MAKRNRNTKTTSRKQSQKKRLIITTLAVGATGIIGYFGWQYFKKKQEAKHTDIDALISSMDQSIVATPVLPVNKLKTKPKPQTSSTAATSRQSDDFPLKQGSKGENVRRLQQALVTKYGKQALPKYGVDGDFGSELAAALKKFSLPAFISESTLNVLTQGTIINPTILGKDLYDAVLSSDYTKTIALLKKMNSVDDYTNANKPLKRSASMVYIRPLLMACWMYLALKRRSKLSSLNFCA